MSPPEVWGPAVWGIFHTLAEKINDDNNVVLVQNVFGFIKRICVFLPCPECSKDATAYLQRVKQSELKNKQVLVNTLYMFHNYVNHKKKKKMFNYGDIVKYKSANLLEVFNRFLGAYNTTGNMNLIAESFQRKLIITDLKKWLFANIKSFMPKPIKAVASPINVIEPVVLEPVVVEPVVVEPVVVEPEVVEAEVVEPVVTIDIELMQSEEKEQQQQQEQDVAVSD